MEPLRNRVAEALCATLEILNGKLLETNKPNEIDAIICGIEDVVSLMKDTYTKVGDE